MSRVSVNFVDGTDSIVTRFPVHETCGTFFLLCNMYAILLMASAICYAFFPFPQVKFPHFSSYLNTTSVQRNDLKQSLTIKVNFILIFLQDYLQKLLLLSTENHKSAFLDLFFSISKVKLQGISILGLGK